MPSGDVNTMEVNQDQGQDASADEVMDSVGVSEGKPEHAQEEPKETNEHSKETLAVQKRLKAQKRAHEREVRELHARIGDLESRMTQPTMQTDQAANPYNAQPNNGGNIDEHIHKAVSIALQHKEMEERKARDMQAQQHVHRQYQEFQKHLDNMGDKYDDFHDVVLGNDTPYTPAMRDYALTLPRSGAGSAGEVLYKLGKNPEELRRITQLHPLDQASEIARLSHALISGGETKNSASRPPLGNIKSNPVTNSHAITDKTPVGELRARMKANWK